MQGRCDELKQVCHFRRRSRGQLGACRQGSLAWSSDPGSVPHGWMALGELLNLSVLLWLPERWGPEQSLLMPVGGTPFVKHSALQRGHGRLISKSQQHLGLPAQAMGASAPASPGGHWPVCLAP